MTTPTAIPAHYTGEERSKRIFAIVGASSGNFVVYMCMQPLFGMLADKIGRRNSMLWFGVLGTHHDL